MIGLAGAAGAGGAGGGGPAPEAPDSAAPKAPAPGGGAGAVLDVGGSARAGDQEPGRGELLVGAHHGRPGQPERRGQGPGGGQPVAVVDLAAGDGVDQRVRHLAGPGPGRPFRSSVKLTGVAVRISRSHPPTRGRRDGAGQEAGDRQGRRRVQSQIGLRVFIGPRPLRARFRPVMLASAPVAGRTVPGDPPPPPFRSRMVSQVPAHPVGQRARPTGRAGDHAGEGHRRDTSARSRPVPTRHGWPGADRRSPAGIGPARRAVRPSRPAGVPVRRRSRVRARSGSATGDQHGELGDARTRRCRALRRRWPTGPSTWRADSGLPAPRLDQASSPPDRPGRLRSYAVTSRDACIGGGGCVEAARRSRGRER